MRKLLIWCNILIMLVCLSCSSQKCLPDIEYRDSVRIEYKLDSVYHYERDSIYLDRSADTIYKEVWHWRYKDKIVEKTDTIYNNQQIVQTKVERYIPAFFKWCTGLFFAVVLAGIIRIIIKIYLRR